VPHGLACGICLPAVLRFNADDASLGDLAERLNLSGSAALADAVLALLDELKVREAARGMVGDVGALRPLAAEMTTADRAGNNPRPAGPDDISRLVDEIVAWLSGETAS
jgi:alcohol dehydrogenase class IV